MVSFDRLKQLTADALDEVATATNRLAAAQVAASNAHTRVNHVASLIENVQVVEALQALQMVDNKIDEAGEQLDGVTQSLRGFLQG